METLLVCLTVCSMTSSSVDLFVQPVTLTVIRKKYDLLYPLTLSTYYTIRQVLGRPYNVTFTVTDRIFSSCRIALFKGFKLTWNLAARIGTDAITIAIISRTATTIKAMCVLILGTPLM